jgi:hypothetical protein
MAHAVGALKVDNTARQDAVPRRNDETAFQIAPDQEFLD